MMKGKKKNMDVKVSTKPTALGYGVGAVVAGAVIGSTLRNVKWSIDTAKGVKNRLVEKKNKKHESEEK